MIDCYCIRVEDEEQGKQTENSSNKMGSKPAISIITLNFNVPDASNKRQTVKRYI